MGWERCNALKNPLVLTMVILFSAVSIGAGIYKWVDEKGVTHYSDTPASDQKSKKIEASPPPETGITQKSWQQKEHEFRQRRLEAEEAEEKQKQKEAIRIKEEQRQRCARAKNELDWREKHPPVPGKTGYVGEREQAIEEARNAVKKWCAEEKE